MYSIASWSPSQSDPLTVSYICQRQSSGCMLPSAAEMPPCAATVCERVGNNFVMQAAGSPAGPDLDDVVAVVLDRIGLSVGGGSATAVCGPAVAISGHALNSR